MKKHYFFILILVIISLFFACSNESPIQPDYDLEEGEEINTNLEIVGTYVHPLHTNMQYVFQSDGKLKVSYLDNVVLMDWIADYDTLTITNETGDSTQYNFRYIKNNGSSYLGRQFDPELRIWKNSEDENSQFLLAGEYPATIREDLKLKDGQIIRYHNGEITPYYLFQYTEYLESYFCRPHVFSNTPFFTIDRDVIEDGSSFEIANYVEGSEIHYWINELDAATEIKIYSDPIIIDQTMSKISAVTIFEEEVNGKIVQKESSPTVLEFSVKALPPTFSIPEGIYSYEDSLEVTLITVSPGTEIFYTLDGSDPSTSPTTKKYDEIIEIINESVTIRAIVGGENYLFSDESSAFYHLAGPGGGFVFYDKGEYSDGWRYMEATPDLLYINHFYLSHDPFIEEKRAGVGMIEGASFGDPSFQFGYYRDFDTGLTTKVGDTSALIGEGKRNTERIVTVMGDYAYTSNNITNNDTFPLYAAKACWDLEYGGFTDWHLPSHHELRAYNDYARDRNLKIATGSSTEGSATKFFGYGAFAEEKNRQVNIIAIRYF